MERQHRSAAGGGRTLRGRCRRSAIGQFRASAQPAPVGARRRSQRARIRHERWRPGDRPVAAQRDSRRPDGAHCTGSGWRALARARSRNTGVRLGHHRRYGLQYWRGRPDPRRWTRLVDGKARARHRQPALGRRRHSGRTVPQSECRRSSGSVLGAPRWRRELRHRHLDGVPAAPGVAGPRRARDLSAGSGS